MKQKTAMASAFEAAGYDANAARLAALCDEKIKLLDRARAVLAIAHGVIADKELLRALIEFYIERRGTDGVEGHPAVENHNPHAPAPSNQLPGEGRFFADSQVISAQARQPDDSGGGQKSNDTHWPDASPAVIPPRERTPAERAAAIRIVSDSAKSVLDSHRLSNGVAIGDVRWGSLHRMRSASARDAALLRLLINLGNADPNAKVRDIVTTEVMERLIQKAAEMSDAA